MKLTNGDIFAASGPLRELATVKFPVGVSFRIAELITKMNVPLGVIEGVRNELVKKYGSADETGRIRVPEGTPEYEQFSTEVEELFEIEADVEFQKVKLPPDGAEIEPRVLIALTKLIEVGE